MDVKPDAALITGICGWEFVALTTGLIPTITSITRYCRRRHPLVTSVVVCSGLGWAFWHLLVSDK